MALMVRYCEKHGHAWPVSERRGKNPLCPVAPETQPTPCPIVSVDAIEKINDLAGNLEAAEETAADE